MVKAKRIAQTQKRKLLNKPLELHDNIDDIEVTQEDLDFYKEQGLLEQESRHRSFDYGDVSAAKLPIKSSDGAWKKNDRVPVKKEHPQEDEQIPVKKEKPVVKEEVQLSFAEKRVKVGLLAAAILESPEENIHKLKELKQYTMDKDSKTVKLSLLASLAVYRDIIPGYRIRQLSDKERTTKVSKDVARLRDYEGTLLSNYQAYLQLLDDLVKKHTPKADQKTDYTMLMTCIKCLTSMLVAGSHFNYRNNLLASVISRMNLHLSDPGKAAKYGYTLDAPSVMCCEAVKQVFENDELGEVSMEAVTLVSALVKQKAFRLKPCVLECFLHLELHSAMSEPERKKRKMHKNKKEPKKYQSKKVRKLTKIEQEVEEELKEAEAVVSNEEREKFQMATLKQIFVAYFRVLKMGTNSPLIPTTMRGIAKFGHLLSIEYFNDLILNIRNVITQSDKLNLVERLECVVTGFQLMSGHSEALIIDLTDFYYEAYKCCRLAAEFIQEGGSEQNLVEAVDVFVQVAFLKKRTNQPSRIAAFIKRLSTLSLSFKQIGPLLTLLGSINSLLVVAPPKVQELLHTDDPEDQLTATTQYDAEIDNPDTCMPFATQLWELTALSQHQDKQVQAWFKNLKLLVKSD